MKGLYRKYVFTHQKLHKLSSKNKQRHTFFLHLIYSILNGIILGVLALNEFVLIKNLKGSDYQIAFLVQFTTLILIFSVFLNELLRRTKHKKRMLRITALITRLPLLALFFFPNNLQTVSNSFIYQLIFLGIFLLYYSANPIIFPLINQLLKNNYETKNFSKFYSYATTVNKIVILLVTFGTGILFDKYPNAYTYVYPFLAILGISAIFILLKIEYKAPEIDEIQRGFYDSVKKSLVSLWNILRHNKPYRDFEIGFMLYGFAWLSTSAVVALFLEKSLGLSYTNIAFYKNTYTIISIVLTPLAGKLLGKIDPRKFAIFNFGALLLYIFFMGMSEYVTPGIKIYNIFIQWTLLASYIFYGLFAAMMGMLWYIGSAYFCKTHQVAEYQAIHLSLTGMRGVFAPLIGIFFYRMIGYSGVYLLAIIFLSLSILLMLWSMKKRKM